MLAVLTISIALGGNQIKVVPGPPNNIVVNGTQRTLVSGTTNTQTAKDRIYTVQTTSLTVTDYMASVARLDFPTFVSDNPSIPIDPVIGSAPFVVNGSATLFANCLISGSFAAYDVNWASNTVTASSNLLGFVNLSLASNLVWSVSNSFSGKSISQWGYNPSQADLGTNSNVWTYPPSLSCVGITAAGYQTCLISPTVVLGNNHIGGVYIGNTVTFTDVNGVKRVGTFSSTTPGPNDFLIATLSSPMPSSVVPASILPVYATNNVSSWLGLFTVWAHKNTAHMDLAYVASYPNNFIYNGGNGMFCSNARTNIFGNEIGATGGDSGSPCFFMLTNTTIVAFTATSPGDVAGDFITDGTYWTWLTNNVPIATLNIVNLSGYPTY